MFGTCATCGATCVRVYLASRGAETGHCAECIGAGRVDHDAEYVATRVGILR